MQIFTVKEEGGSNASINMQGNVGHNIPHCLMTILNHLGISSLEQF